MNNLFKNSALNLLFPKFCFGCKKEGTYLCEDCKELLEISQFNYCLCQFQATRIEPSSKKGKCPKCQKNKLSGVYSALSYKENRLTQSLIRNFKYPPYVKDLAKTLANVLIEHFVLTGNNTNDIWKNSVLTPVPTDKKKMKERGYNQSEELAKELSKVLQVPVVSNVLVKIKHTKSQMELKKEEREKNLLGAFGINQNIKTSEVPIFSGKKVFLVDDVYTTGATLNECSGVLLEASAKSVWGICIAREG